jgi:hypothetical protein
MHRVTFDMTIRDVATRYRLLFDDYNNPNNDPFKKLYVEAQIWNFDNVIIDIMSPDDRNNLLKIFDNDLYDKLSKTKFSIDDLLPGI